LDVGQSLVLDVAIGCRTMAVLLLVVGVGVDVFEAVVLYQVLSYRAPAGADAWNFVSFLRVFLNGGDLR
jgi:hypothetical protein